MRSWTCSTRAQWSGPVRVSIGAAHTFVSVCATFRSLADAWADTTTAHGRLIVTVLGGLAEFERELIRVRTTEGRVRAVAAGVRMGRKPSLSPTQCAHAVEMREAEKSLQEIGDVLGVSHMTVWRITDRASRTSGIA